MALEFFFNTPAKTDSGTSLSSAYARLQFVLLPDEATAQVRLDLYESSTAFFNNRKTVFLDEIPNELHSFLSPVTSGQYANVDMTNIHSQMSGILLIGASHGSYPPIASEPNWEGLQSIDPSNDITTVMPS